MKSVLDSFNLAGRTALITGSSGGIGHALARGLASAGATVVLNGRDVGRFGEIHPRILEAYTLVQPVVAFELDVAPLRSSRPGREKVFPGSGDGEPLR